jgi:hypothetical protein
MVSICRVLLTNHEHIIALEFLDKGSYHGYDN